jgi:hypothetical protein
MGVARKDRGRILGVPEGSEKSKIGPKKVCFFVHIKMHKSVQKCVFWSFFGVKKKSKNELYFRLRGREDVLKNDRGGLKKRQNLDLGFRGPAVVPVGVRKAAKVTK